MMRSEGPQVANHRPRVTAEDIIACIEMVLGRTPHPSLVEYHLGLDFPDRFALGQYMINTGEFRARFFNENEQNRPTAIYLGDRILATTHRGDVIYLIPTDLDLTPEIILRGGWERHVEAAIVGALHPGNTVIDIGANVGYHTLAMAAAVGPEGKVHAFEANLDVTRLLRATMFVNGFSSWRGIGRVDVHPNAVLDRAGTVTLAAAPDHYGSGHVANALTAADYSKRVEVPGVTLDGFLAARGVETVDLVHMDIEGSEPLALQGGQKLIERSPGIKIIMEWSVGMMSSRANVKEFVSWLLQQDFKFWLIEREACLTRLDPAVLPTLPHCDIFLTRSDPSG
jgi:FkbM family methyltransferase